MLRDILFGCAKIWYACYRQLDSSQKQRMALHSTVSAQSCPSYPPPYHPPHTPYSPPTPPPCNLPVPSLVVTAGEANGSLWVYVSLSSLAAIHCQPAPQWQVEAVGRTPLFVGECVQNSALATTL